MQTGLCRNESGVDRGLKDHVTTTNSPIFDFPFHFKVRDFVNKSFHILKNDPGFEALSIFSHNACSCD